MKIKRMMAVFGMLGCVAIGASTGASCSSGTQSQITQDVGGVAACVIQHCATDQSPTFESVAAECAGATVTAVEEIVQALVQSSATDAGGAPPASKLAKIHHKGT